MKRQLILIPLLLAVFFASVAMTLPARWELLGQRVVNLRVDHDEILVTGFEGSFDKVKLKVLRGGIEFLDMKIHYANGGVEDVALRQLIPAGGETRVIDLRANNRVIRKVTFWYKSPGRRAVVQVWGEH
jgi:Protein of unknown function (DUF2541)